MDEKPEADPLMDLLAEAERMSPDGLAVQCGETRLTFRELRAAVSDLAARLPSLCGRRVLLLLPDRIAAYLFHVLCFRAGAILIPVSPQTTSARLQQICAKVQPQLIVTTAFLHERHRAVFPEPVSLALVDGEEIRFVADESLNAGKEHPTELRLIVFTSGSTGEPKGVCLTANNILFAARSNAAVLEFDQTRRSVVTVPLYDYYGFIQIHSHLSACSACIFGASPAFPKRILELITASAATDLVLVPYTLRQLLEAGDSAGFAGLKYVTSSSDVLDPGLVRRLLLLNPNLTVFDIYGLTEAGRTAFRRITAPGDDSRSIGQPAAGVALRLDGRDQIVIQGPNVMAGYLSQVRDGTVVVASVAELQTGDLGQYDARGEIVLLGRREGLLNINGAKIFAAEIERLALSVSGVRDALARSAVRDGENGIELELLADATSVDHAVRECLRRSLPAALVPRRISFVRRIERTEIGAKLVRRAGAA